MKKIIFVLLAGGMLLCSSCNNKVATNIIGWWSIDSIFYMNNDIKSCLLNNGLFFHDGDVILPTTENYCDSNISTYINKGMWQIVDSNGRIILDVKSGNQVFSQRFVVKFVKDGKNKLLKMELMSSQIYIMCRKGLFSYDEELINELVEKTTYD